jgi:hypothetical protein
VLVSPKTGLIRKNSDIIGSRSALFDQQLSSSSAPMGQEPREKIISQEDRRRGAAKHDDDYKTAVKQEVSTSTMGYLHSPPVARASSSLTRTTEEEATNKSNTGVEERDCTEETVPPSPDSWTVLQDISLDKLEGYLSQGSVIGEDDDPDDNLLFEELSEGG